MECKYPHIKGNKNPNNQYPRPAQKNNQWQATVEINSPHGLGLASIIQPMPTHAGPVDYYSFLEPVMQKILDMERKLH